MQLDFLSYLVDDPLVSEPGWIVAVENLVSTLLL